MNERRTIRVSDPRKRTLGRAGVRLVIHEHRGPRFCKRTWNFKATLKAHVLMKKVQYGPTNMVIYRQVSLKHNIMPQRVNVFFSSTFILCSPYVLYCLCQSRRVCCCPEVPIPPLVLWSPVYMECRNDRHFVLRVRSLSLSLSLSPQKHCSSVSGQSGAFPHVTPAIFTEVFIPRFWELPASTFVKC